MPVLVGTRSIEKSEKLSTLLTAAGIEHQVLNAKNHEIEAQIVAQAGQIGRVTVATNMAGRGTDIKLGEGVAELGGLHVIGTERHESRRIDRQLAGRCARQGDPGSPSSSSRSRTRSSRPSARSRPPGSASVTQAGAS